MAKTAAGKATRHRELRQMLEDRRRELVNEVQSKKRDVRAHGAERVAHEVHGDADGAEADTHEDIEFALIQMKAETLNKINEALRRLDEATYGNCFECGDEIVEARLRALPFALRCKDCEEARENAEQRERVASRGFGGSLFDPT